MKAKIKWLLNGREIQAAEAAKRMKKKFAISEPIPEPKFETQDVYFKLSDVKLAYYDETSKTMDFRIDGELYKFQVDIKVFDKVKKHLGAN